MNPTAGVWSRRDRPVYFVTAKFDAREVTALTNVTGGNWTAEERTAYFLASDLSHQQTGAIFHGYILIAVNELQPARFDLIDEFIDRGAKVLIDSGIFWLTNEHARAHGVPMDVALGLAPEAIDNFDWLWTRYLEVVRRFGDRCWGYIELDQGGRDNKRITRAKLHDLGLNPIPVYHPLNDGREYFDELATDYARICWGNVVQAKADVRKRMLATAWERHRAYPDLWIHFLGLTPSQALNAYPADSADSSTWLASVRWDGVIERSMLRTLGPLEPEFRYDLEAEAESPHGHHKAATMAAVSVAMMQRGWHHWESRVLGEFDLAMYPPREEGDVITWLE